MDEDAQVTGLEVCEEPADEVSVVPKLEAVCVQVSLGIDVELGPLDETLHCVALELEAVCVQVSIVFVEEPGPLEEAVQVGWLVGELEEGASLVV